MLSQSALAMLGALAVLPNRAHKVASGSRAMNGEPNPLPSTSFTPRVVVARRPVPLWLYIAVRAAPLLRLLERVYQG